MEIGLEEYHFVSAVSFNKNITFFF